MPPDEKERIFHELEAESPQRRLSRSRPLAAAQRQRGQRIKRQLNARKSS